MINRFEDDDRIPLTYLAIIAIFVAAPCLVAGIVISRLVW